jgi:hypothetical protein
MVSAQDWDFDVPLFGDHFPFNRRDMSKPYKLATGENDFSSR